MASLCGQCRHRRAADPTMLNATSATSLNPRAQAALNRQRNELITEIRLEDLAFGRTGPCLPGTQASRQTGTWLLHRKHAL